MAQSRHQGTGDFWSRIDPEALDLRALTEPGRSVHRLALTVAGVFVLVGLAWVFLTDVLLYRVLDDRVLIARIETAKAWIFVGAGGALLYGVTLRSAARLARLRRLTTAVVESIADGVLLLGRDRSIAHANLAASRMLRCPVKDLVGMGASDFSRRFRVSYTNGALVPPEQYISQRVFEEGGPMRYKAVLHPPGGDDVVISATAAAVRTSVDEPAAWVVSVMHDITDSENLERLRDRFFASAAHSLKTPIAVIKANTQALLQRLSPGHRPLAASLERQCDRIDRLIQNVLVLSRAHSQTLELYPGRVALESLVERVARESTGSQRNEVRGEVTGSPRLYADEERLALVIRNLVHEASRSSPAESPLTIRAASRGDHVTLGVRYRRDPVDENRSGVYAEFDDIGIGRCVVAAIVEAHGGSLHEDLSESEASIWVELPSELEEAA